MFNMFHRRPRKLFILTWKVLHLRDFELQTPSGIAEVLQPSEVFEASLGLEKTNAETRPRFRENAIGLDLLGWQRKPANCELKRIHLGCEMDL